MNNVYSKLFWLGLGSQGEAGEVFEDPLVFQCVVDDFDQLSGPERFWPFRLRGVV